MTQVLTLAQFGAKLAGFAMAVKAEERRALTQAARIIEAEAKAEIGHYQGAAGPFAAWPELAEATKAERVRQGFTENDPLLRTGEMRDSISHVVGDREAAVGSNDEKAVWQELGTRTIPPRSFLGGAAMRKAPEVARTLGAAPLVALAGPGIIARLPKP